MPYFKISMSSAMYCGFNSTFYREAESEEALEESGEIQNIEGQMHDYISGYCDLDEDDFEDEDAYFEAYDEDCEVSFDGIEEVTKEEYDEYAESSGIG